MNPLTVLMNASKKPLVLRNRQQFRRVYERGRRFNTPYFSAFVLGTEGDEQRYGITVTRKIGNAVLRNRCKRRLREVIRKYHAGLAPGEADLPGYDLVLNVKSEMLEAEFSGLEKSFEQTIQGFIRTAV